MMTSIYDDPKPSTSKFISPIKSRTDPTSPASGGNTSTSSRSYSTSPTPSDTPNYPTPALQSRTKVDEEQRNSRHGVSPNKSDKGKKSSKHGASPKNSNKQNKSSRDSTSSRKDNEEQKNPNLHPNMKMKKTNRPKATILQKERKEE